MTGLSIAGVREFHLQQRSHLLRKLRGHAKFVRAPLSGGGTRRDTCSNPESAQNLLYLIRQMGRRRDDTEVIAMELPMTVAPPQPTNYLLANRLRRRHERRGNMLLVALSPERAENAGQHRRI